ncbi:hypothetical protein CF336_g7460, partial [Tilletia laevis]
MPESDQTSFLTSSPVSSVLPPSALESLQVVTLNCGPGGLRARQREFTPASRNLLATADIICLQESRVRSPILPDQPDLLRAYFNTPLPPTTRALLTNDCSILIRSSSLVIEEWDFGKHWAYIRVSLPPPPPFSFSQPLPPPICFGIFFIHGPFTQVDWAPIQAAVVRLHPNPTLPCIFGADWNSIPDIILDSSNARPTGTPWSTPATFLSPLHLTNAFHLLHPTDPGWTFYRITRAAGGPVLTSARRLDSILCSGPFVPSLYTSASVFTSSDHHAVSASFGLPSTPSTLSASATDPPTDRTLTWALHPGLWQSIPFLLDVRAFAARYHPTNDSLPLTPLQAWKLLSVTTQYHLQSLSVSHGATQRLLLDDLATVSAALVSLDCRSPLDMMALPSLLVRFRNALAALDLALTLPYASRLAAAELRLSSWLSKASASPRTIPLPALMCDGRLFESPDDKLAAICAFYTSLYTLPPLPHTFETDCATLFHHLLSALPLAHTDQLSTPFTADEVADALRLANRRASPGPDGLPYRAWSELLPVAGPLLASLANALGAGASLEVTARTILLPKAGDLSNLANYRPISISNSYVRTLARMLSARLLTVASFLLPWNQAAFLPGRHTTLVSGLLQGLIDTATAPQSHPAAPAAFFVISLDQRKAYDRVRHEWLFACLRRLGDPSSCIIYNLTLQPFLDLLRAWGVGIMVPGLGSLTSLAFADDVLIFIDASVRGFQQWHALQSALALYERASNAQINIAKSSFWLVGSPADASAASTLAATIASYGLANQDHRAFLTHLGHPITLWPGPPTDALVSRLAAIRTRALCFPTIGVSVLNRVQKSKQFLTSRLWHSISLGGLPHNFNDLYFAALNPYLFAPTHPYISLDDLVRPRSLGGFNLLHPDQMATALTISFLRNCLSDPGPMGRWLRFGLTAELFHRYSTPPAILLARSSPSFTALQHADARAEGLLGRLLHALASVDLGIAPEWKDLPEAAIVTLPWLLLFPSLVLTDQRQVKYLRSHWVTVGDMLWLGPRPHPAAPVPTFLGLPPSRSATAHNRLSSAHDTFGGVPSLPWSTMWSQLEPRLSSALTSYCLGSPSLYRLLTPDASRSRTPSETWIPLSVDPAYPSFPWHLLTITGRSILTASPRSVRHSLTPQEPRVPGWTFDPAVSPSFWSTVWTELEASPLPMDMRSACLLVLGRNLWTYRPVPPPGDSTARSAALRRTPRRTASACAPRPYGSGLPVSPSSRLWGSPHPSPSARGPSSEHGSTCLASAADSCFGETPSSSPSTRLAPLRVATPGPVPLLQTSTIVTPWTS